MTVKTVMGFIPFHFVHGVEVVSPIECEIPTFRTTIELLLDTTLLEQCLIALETINEDRWSSLQHNEVAKKCSKAAFDFQVNPRSFNEGDLVPVYDMSHNTLGNGKFESLWHDLFIVKYYLAKGAYILTNLEGNLFKDLINELYLKRFYP